MSLRELRHYSDRVSMTDGLVGAWVVTWIVIGVLVALQVNQLQQFGDTLTTTSTALDDTASGLKVIGNLPLVGGKVDSIANNIESSSSDMRTSARNARHAAFRLAILLGITVAVTPTVPLLALYVPGRLRQLREAAAVSEAMKNGKNAFTARYLANKALHDLPPDLLAQMSSDPWQEVEKGNYGPLANLELRHLGLDQDLEQRRRGA